MATTIQNLTFDGLYKTVAAYTVPVYKQCILQYMLLNNTHLQGYSRLPVFGEFLKQKSFAAYTVSKTFVWNYKEWIAGGIAVAIAMYKTYQWWINRPLYPPIYTMSTQTTLEIRIENPHKKPEPPNVTLVFCVDVSGSMAGDSITAVHEALEFILNDAQSEVNQGAKVRLEIVAFDDTAEITTPITDLTIKGEETLKKVKAEAAALSTKGGTQILAGLETASQELIKHCRGTPTIVFLSDGGDNFNPDNLNDIHARLASVRAKLFAIGIGTGHREPVLRSIVKGEGFEGKYIAAPKAEDLKREMIAIYKRALSPFSNLRLSTQQLPPGSWSVKHAVTTTENKQQICDLGSIGNGNRSVRYVQIDGEKLPGEVDLSTVFFDLEFTDPYGRKGHQKIWWNANTIVDPVILRKAHAQ